MRATEKEIGAMKVRIREYIRNSKMESRSHIARSITCADGFKVSVQAGEFHYCSPRRDDSEWNSVELGFPLRLMILSKNMQKTLTDLRKQYMATCRLILWRVLLSSTEGLRRNDNLQFNPV